MSVQAGHPLRPSCESVHAAACRVVLFCGRGGFEPMIPLRAFQEGRGKELEIAGAMCTDIAGLYVLCVDAHIRLAGRTRLHTNCLGFSHTLTAHDSSHANPHLHTFTFPNSLAFPPSHSHFTSSQGGLLRSTAH
eukprot:6208520-Pleurochrysis_carterae.AAC.3